MDAEIIAVGSEMLTPQRVDTNSLYLTGELNNLGVEVVTKCVIGDDRERLADAVHRALKRSEIVILSGGLGPTEDDLTRESVAQALDRKLEFHPEIATGAGRALRPHEAQNGGDEQAPGLHHPGRRDFAQRPRHCARPMGGGVRRVVMLLPGPPHELKAMFEQQCLPRLARVVPKQAIRTLHMRVTGMSESDLDQPSRRSIRNTPTR